MIQVSQKRDIRKKMNTGFQISNNDVKEYKNCTDRMTTFCNWC